MTVQRVFWAGVLLWAIGLVTWITAGTVWGRRVAGRRREAAAARQAG